jgi:L-aspartate oxidase
LVFGARAGQAMMKDFPVKKRSAAKLPGSPAPRLENGKHAQASKAAANHPAAFTKIRDLMWRQVGILRNGKDLSSAIQQLQEIELPKSEKPGRAEHELRNLHELALIVARCALAREESRGSQYRSDFAYRNDEDFAKHSVAQKGKEVRFEA